jgi:predicted transcriptional regulator
MQKNQPSSLGNPRMGYSIAETAYILGISQRSVHRLLKRGLLRASKALRKVIIPQTEIAKFLIDTTEAS